MTEGILNCCKVSMILLRQKGFHQACQTCRSAIQHLCTQECHGDANAGTSFTGKDFARATNMGVRPPQETYSSRVTTKGSYSAGW
jgi:hypothetical protein